MASIKIGESRHFVALLLVAIILVTTGPRSSLAALSCSDVYSALIPCLTYVQSGGFVPPGCCAGIERLFNQARTTTDLHTSCNCLKGAAAGASPAYLRRAGELPGKCHMSLPYPISPTTDCSRIHT